MIGERPAASPISRGERNALLAVGLVALAARLPPFLAGRPLWLDEALLAQNLVDPGRGPLDPLYNLQAAPIGFLVPVELTVGILGYDERVFRLLPFIAGLAAVFLTWAAARRLFGAPIAGLAAGFVAVSPLLVRYSNELKPYASDALLGALGLWLAARWLDEPDRRHEAMLVLGGAAIVIGSIPGVFVVLGLAPGIVGATGVATLRERARTAAIATALWSASFAALYFSFYRATEGRMLEAFRPGGGLRETALAVRGFVGAALVGPDAEAALLPGTVGVFALLLAAGIVTLLRAHPRRALVVLGPAVLLGIAHILGRWPLTPRVLLWCIPSLAILVAAAARTIHRIVSSRAGPAAGVLAVGAMFAPALFQAWSTSVAPPIRENVPAAMADLRDVAARAADAGPAAGRPDPVVYVAAHALPACRFYAGGIPDRWVCEIPGIRIVEGGWIPLPLTRAGTAAWSAREADVIDRALDREIRLLLAGSEEVRSGIVEAVESRGHVLVERTRYEGVELVRVRRSGADDAP